jgi:hypothetical protein
MRSADYIRIAVIFWAILTLPVYILAALYLGSWKNFIASLDFQNAGSMTISDVGVAVFFLGPWILILLFLLKKVMFRRE